MSDNRDQENLTFDTRRLFRVEQFTDRRAGSIRRLTPVDADGNPDPDRPVQYIGETQALTPAGTLPLNFELDAENLEQAAARFAEGAEQALKETVEELKRLQRESQSSIMVPGQEGSGSNLRGNFGGKPPLK